MPKQIFKLIYKKTFSLHCPFDDLEELWCNDREENEMETLKRTKWQWTSSRTSDTRFSLSRKFLRMYSIDGFFRQR